MTIDAGSVLLAIALPATSMAFAPFVCFIRPSRIQIALGGGDASSDLRFFILFVRCILAPDTPIIISVQMNEQRPGGGVLVLVPTVPLTQPRFSRFDEKLAHVRETTYGEDTEQAAADDNHSDSPRRHVTAARLPNLARRPRPPIHARAAAKNARAASTAVIQCRTVHLFPSPYAHPAAAGRAHRYIMTARSYPLLIEPHERPTIILTTTRDF